MNTTFWQNLSKLEQFEDSKLNFFYQLRMYVYLTKLIKSQMSEIAENYSKNKLFCTLNIKFTIIFFIEIAKFFEYVSLVLMLSISDAKLCRGREKGEKSGGNSKIQFRQKISLISWIET